MGRQWSGSGLIEMSSGLRSDVQNRIAKDFVVLRALSPHLGSARSARLKDLPSRWCKIMPIAVTECIYKITISGPVSMYLARWMSWCALWRRIWKAWSPPEIHSYSSRWSTGMLLYSLCDLQFRVRQHFCFYSKVLGPPGSSSQPLSGCWTLSQPRLCLRSSQAGWFLLHFSTLIEAQDFKFSFQAKPFEAWAGASYTDQLPHSFGEDKSYWTCTKHQVCAPRAPWCLWAMAPPFGNFLKILLFWTRHPSFMSSLRS